MRALPAGILAASIAVHCASIVAFGAEADRSTTFERAVSDARFSMSQRDLPAARRHLETASAAARTESERDEVARLDELLDYLKQFWNLVRDGMARLQAVEEIQVRGKPVSIVEASRDHLVVRAAGRNLRYRIETLPNSLVMTLAERSLKHDATSKIVVGAYLAIDQRGDRQAARRLWTEAAKEVRTDHLLAELGIERATGPSENASAHLKEKIADLKERSAGTRSMKDQRAIATEALKLAEGAAKAKQFDLAAQLAEIALSAAKKSKNLLLLRQAAMAVKQVELMRKKGT